MVLVGLECLVEHGGVAVFVEADLVKIVVADVDVQVLSPIVGDALVADEAARLERLYPVWTGSKRRLQCGLGDIALATLRVFSLPPVLRQNRQLTHDVGKLAIAS